MFSVEDVSTPSTESSCNNSVSRLSHGHADISQHTCGLTDSSITHSQISVDDVVSWRHPKSKIPEIHKTATTKLTKQRTGPKYKSIRYNKKGLNQHIAIWNQVLDGKICTCIQLNKRTYSHYYTGN